ncbi:hypothetical protein QBC32DRAFT_396760 [Pseudoneurospora amorphoporcata]|uniref:Uncharacterized protein n=1 Tax=Pseudoneurospora amorphoporcata TaxID=241081 RepID=A0AAN6SI49_9PEZI|nr:hypothetical protein QBC32DRAFT_396760 [Pseudoneurospora amorphoporcata]
MPKWEDIRDDLFQAYMAATGPITPVMQASIVDFMEHRGIFSRFRELEGTRSTPTAGLEPALSLDHPSLSTIPTISNSANMSAQRSLTRWDQKTHEDIMLAMFEHFRPTASDMKDIVGLLSPKGHTFTDSALLQHLQKLRRKEGSSAAAGSDSGATSTPSKRKRAAPGSGVKKTPGTGRGKKAAAKTAPLVIDSDGDDDVKESPEKKLKTEAADSKVKEEYDDGLDDYMYPNEI